MFQIMRDWGRMMAVRNWDTYIKCYIAICGTFVAVGSINIIHFMANPFTTLTAV